MGSGGAHKAHHANPGLSRSAERDGVSANKNPSQSLQPSRDSAYGNDDKARLDYLVLDYACRGQCDEHLDGFLSHLRRSLDIPQPRELSQQPSEKKVHDSGQSDFLLAILDGESLGVQVSTMLLSWLQLRGECFRCASRVSALLGLGLSSEDV